MLIPNLKHLSQEVLKKMILCSGFYVFLCFKTWDEAILDPKTIFAHTG